MPASFQPSEQNLKQICSNCGAFKLRQQENSLVEDRKFKSALYSLAHHVFDHSGCEGRMCDLTHNVVGNVYIISYTVRKISMMKYEMK